MNKYPGKLRIGAMPIFCAVALAVLTIANPTASHAQLSASPWPMFHHDLNHTGLSQYDTSANPGSLKWAFSTYNAVNAQPTISSRGIIYVGSFDTRFYAVNPDGTKKWTFFGAGGAVNTAAAVGADGTIYFGSFDHNLYALSFNGSLKWTFATGSEVHSSPAIGADGTIYVGSDRRQPLRGKPRRLRRSGRSQPALRLATSSPAIGADGTIYVGSETTTSTR